MDFVAAYTVLGKRPMRLLRQVVVASVICLVIYYLVLGRQPGLLDSSSLSSWPQQQMPITRNDEDGGILNEDQREPPLPRPPLSELLENRSLTEDQCRAQFPGLFKEIDDAVARGPFPLRPRNQTGHLGPLTARIRNGKLSILAYQRKVDLSKDMLQHRSATLHQIANALLTWPSPSSSPPPPDTIIAFNHLDDPLPGTWSYSRPADPALFDAAAAPCFPIPHFAFYAWPVATIASLGHAAARVDELEAGAGASSWSNKIPRAVWRGTTWFNSARSGGSGRARQNLLHATRGEEAWADVEALSPSPPSSPSGNSRSSRKKYSNALGMADFCRYRYVIYTEGITYSGRLPFHQLCRSVLLTPPIAWLQHTTHLVRPVFSHSLPGVERVVVPTSGTSEEGSDGKNVKSGGGDITKRSRGFGCDDKDDNSTPGMDTNTTAASATTPNTLRQRKAEEQRLAPYPAPWVQSAWPRSFAPSEANAVFVAPDWSDLKATVAWLEAHPNVAEGIAGRQRALFSFPSSSSTSGAQGLGYLSPAAEACYWRALISGWAGVADTEGSGWDDDDDDGHDGDEDGDGGYNAEGILWEEFSLEIHK